MAASVHPPSASDPGARSRMSSQAQRDTRPELALRRLLHARGLRYLVDAPLPLSGSRRRSDLTFVRARVVVFVDGCFWHGCPEHATRPRSNAAWWGEKLAANKARDADTDARMREAGWIVVRIWEHEPADRAANMVEAVVRLSTASPRGSARQSDVAPVEWCSSCTSDTRARPVDP